MKLAFSYIIFVFIIIQQSYAQDFNSSFYSDPTINKNDSTKLFLRVENTNFFKNDEYFGKLTSGLTYIGTFVRPELVYQPYSKIRIVAGVHLLKYSGLGVFTQALPVFSFQYAPSKSFQFIMGSLNSGANHRIIEPLYSFENHLVNNLENGAQLLVHKKRFSADIWLNWEKYIFKTSNEQESILGGVHLDYLLLGKKEASNLKLDFQSLVAHKGGQFHSAEVSLQTIANTASGFVYTKTNEAQKIKAMGFESHYLTFNDASSTPQYAYLMGYAVYSNAFLYTKYLNFRLGYWSGEDFVSTRGNQLFMSVSDKNPQFVLPRTELITAKVAFKKQLFKDIIFEARFEPYMDIQQRQFEYSYSFHIIFNRDFFLRKI